MSRPNSLKLAVVLAVVWCVGAASIPLREALFITQYDGDALHLLDIVGRMVAGQAIHVDFVTPIGALAFWPMALFAGAGWAPGIAFGQGQALFAAGVAPLLWRACQSRLPPFSGYLFGAVALALVLSLSHGVDGGLAVSMHYNRWAWVLAFVPVLLVLLPDRGGARPVLDGILVALAMAGLVLLKMTYAVALGPVLVIAALLCGRGRMLAAGAISGVVLAAGLSVLLGPAHWLGYYTDLSHVAESALRRSPGLPLPDLLVSAHYLPSTLVVLGGVLALRRSGHAGEGLSLLLLFGAFVYVTWQNFGNDPLWLMVVAPVMIALRPGPDQPGNRQALTALGGAAALLVAPLAINHSISPIRHLFEPPARFTEIAPDTRMLMPERPAELIRGRINLNQQGEMFDVVADPDADKTPLSIAAVPLSSCQVTTGLPSAMAALARDVQRAEGPVFVADILGAHWLYGLPPLPGAAPWNYGALDGLDRASHVAVPLCPVSETVRRALVTLLNDAEPGLELVWETPRVLVFRRP